jgi:hypothetical protein
MPVTQVKKSAFLLYGTSVRAAKELRESFTQRVVRAFPSVYVRDISALNYTDIRVVHQLLEKRGYTPTIYVKEGALPTTVTESWLRVNSTYGMLRQSRDARDMNLIVLGKHGVMEMVAHAATLLEAEGAKPAKAPSEVDRLRTQQKQQDLLTKKRENDQLLQAKQRELSKKSREQYQKLTQPKGAK